LSLKVAARDLATTDVIMIFWQAAVAIKDHNSLLRASAKKLHIGEVTVGNLLPSLTLFPFHHVNKPSNINYQTGTGLPCEVEWIGQILEASVEKVCHVGFFFCSLLC